MKQALKKGATDQSLLIFIQDSASTTGAGKTGLAYNTASLVCYYARPGAAAAALTLATQTVTGAHSDGGFVEVDATNMPGVYRLDLSDAILAAGVNSVVVMLKGASGMAPLVLEIQLTDFDLNTATPKVDLDTIKTQSVTCAAGVTIPASIASPTNITSASGVQLAADQAVNVTKINGTAQTAGDLAALINTIDDFLDTEIAAILADTNELQTDLVNGGRLDLLIDAIKAKTDNLPASPAAVGSEMTLTAAYDAAKTAATQASVNTIDDFLDTEITAILEDTGTTIPATLATLAGYIDTEVASILAAVDTEVAAIKAKTDNLPTDPADQSAVEAAITAATSPLATAAALDAVDNYVDTEVAAIKAVTDKLDTAMEFDGAVYKFTTNALEQAPTGGVSAPTAAEVADAVWDEVLDTAHEVAGSASVLLQDSGAAGDPMSVAVPGAYAEGTAGYVIGHLESSGSGSVYWPYTVTDSATGNPIAGVTVSVSTDIAGSVVVASGTTNASGVVNFNLDPGTYYLWLSKTGYTFTNPDTEVIA